MATRSNPSSRFRVVSALPSNRQPSGRCTRRTRPRMPILGYVDVGQHVPHQNEIHRWYAAPRFDQVQLAILDHPPDRILELPLHEIGRREPAGHLQLTVPSDPRACEDVAGQIAAQYAHVPRRERGEVLPDDHRDRVRLLAGRAGGAPDRELALCLPPGDHLGEQLCPERFERVHVAEERGLVRGHRGDDLAVQPVRRPGTELGDQELERAEALLACHHRQPRLDQVLLARLEQNRRALADKLPDVVKPAAPRRW